MFQMKQIVAALITLTATSAALAVDQQTNMYMLGSIGQSTVAIDKGSFDSDLTAGGFPPLSSSTDESSTAYKLQLGYQINQNFAVEGGYVSLGKASYSATVTGGSLKSEFKGSGWNVAAVGIMPINNEISLLGKVGLIRAKAENIISAVGVGGSVIESGSASEWAPTFGIGAALNFSKNASVRAEYELFSKLGDKNITGEADVKLFSLGLAYKF